MKHIGTKNYLYAPNDFYRDHIYNKNRRGVFTWRYENTRVNGDEGVWIIKKASDDTFTIRNKYYEEYLYTGDIKYSNGARQTVYTWVPKNKVSNSDWKIEETDSKNGRVTIFNTGHKKYLSVGDNAFDLERIFAYASNVTHEWKFEKA